MFFSGFPIPGTRKLIINLSTDKRNEENRGKYQLQLKKGGSRKA